jgi:hypothetical protein
MSASLDFKRTFQYSQALYSVVRFSLKLFYTDRNRYGAKFHTDGLAYLKQVFDQKGLTYE